LSEEVVRFSALRGIYFSRAVSYGNALDLKESDFLDYFSEDSDTEVILMYVEGIRDGEAFFRSLRRAASKKPVVILKGGRGESGSRAAASHTASLAGSRDIWETMVTQAGAVPVKDLDELIDLAVSFHFLPSINGLRVGVAGGGGGASVLAADQCEEAGLDVIPLPIEIREALKREGSTIWDWIGNPVDQSIRDRPDFAPGNILLMMAKHDSFDFLIAIMSELHHERQKGMSADLYLERFNPECREHKPFLAVIQEKGLGIDNYDNWSWKASCEVRTKLLAAGIPFYPTIGRAAKAVRKMVDYYRRNGV
jgi:acyl-CoA synthetase (NDP forming)